MKVTFGSSDKKECIDLRWFDGKMTVKEIRDHCKWKAFKTLHTSFLADVYKHQYRYTYSKKVRFGKVWVFLAEFNSERDR